MSIIVGGALGLTLAASVGVGVAVGSNNEIMEAQAASTFTWNLATNSYSSSSNSKITWSNSYAKMTSEQGGSTTKANNYIPTAQTKTRAYKNFKWTISPTANYVVTKAVFTAEKNSYATAFKNSTWTNATVTTNGTTVTVTATDSAQPFYAILTDTISLTKVVITYDNPSSGFVKLDKSPAYVNTDGDGVTVTATPKNISSPTYSWTTSNSNITLENASSQTVTIKSNTTSAGSATVTLTVGSITKTLTVNIIAPYTVAQAISDVDTNTYSLSKYVSGIICQVDSYNSTYHSITYWISDDGTTTNKMQVYSGKGLNGADFSATSDLVVDAEVTVFGNLKKYNSNYEIDLDNFQTRYFLKTVTGISISGSLTNTLYTDGGLWNPAGLTVIATHNDDTTLDVTGGVTWSYNPATPTIGVTSVTITATYESFTATSSAQSVTVATTPYLNGTAYKMYFYNTVKDSNYYFTGAMGTGNQQYYGATSTTKSEGVDVFFEARSSGSGQNIYFMNGTTKNYFSVVESTSSGSTHYNFHFDSSVPTNPWLYNGSFVVYQVNSSYYTFGTKDSFTTFDSFVSTLTSNYPVQFEASTAITATTFAEDFLANMTCDSTGASAPTFASGYTWADFQVLYNQLDSTEKQTLHDAQANESGTTVEQAMARYDYVVAKYSYNNFINRTISNSSNRMNGIIDNNRVVLITAVLGLLSTTAFAAFYMLRKRKLD